MGFIKLRKKARQFKEWKASKGGVVGRIKSDMRKEEITTHYAEKNRYIPQDIYQKLKQKKECDYCHKAFMNLPNHLPQIHHVIAVEDGGKNEEKNLMAVHKNCHKKLDKAQREAKGGIKE